MTKKPVSLEMQLAGRTAAAESGSDGSPATPVPVKPSPNEKTTVYLPRAALKRVKQMALDQDKRINDLLQEGVELMLARYGQPSLKEFEGK